MVADSQSSRAAREARCLTITAAARLLGVSVATLRNWDRDGKLKAHRHPINKYRLYGERTLLALRQQIEKGSR